MIYNCHTHTLRSHDSNADPLQICESALQNNLIGLAFTDHCDCEFAGSEDIMQQFENGKKDHAAAQKLYGCRMELHFGIELGDPLFNPTFAKSIVRRFPFDVVLLSVHAVRFPQHQEPFSRIDFSAFTKDETISYLHAYYKEVLASVRTFDFDVLSHLTVPLRYIMLKYGINISSEPFAQITDRILGEIVQRGKALEVNTSALNAKNGFLMPDMDIIKRYLDLGGTLFTLGSDAHDAKNVAQGLQEGLSLLKELNVKSLCFYEKRQRRDYTAT